MRTTNRPVESLDRPEGNSLAENYESHDEAEDTFLSLLPNGIEVFPIGIDKRDDDGTLIYDDNPDFLLEGESGGALVDIKSKTRSSWMRFINERHYDKYRDKAAEYELPCYVFFYNTSSEQTILCRVDDDGRVLTTSTHDYMLSFPDRNNAAYLTSGTDVEWTTFVQKLIGRTNQ